MKKANVLTQRVCCTVIFLLSSTLFLLAQKEPPTSVKKLIASGHYLFKAKTVLPASGMAKQLDPGYTLKVYNDTVIADLPYFGKAYSVPSNLYQAGINFTSLQPAYSVLQDKKKRWQITIKPRDVSDVEELSLTVFEDGTADLAINNRDRQSISYRGYITGK